MFKALDKRNEEEIVILDARWREQIELLRAWAAQDKLICQGCRQPVNVKAGDIRRWHFAHKHLENCPYAHASPALLQARAVLYEWLANKFGDEATVEKRLDSANLPRPVDCWVEHKGRRFAYWILEAGMKLGRRETLVAEFAKRDVIVHWIFLFALLREADDPGRVHLTTTERDFRFRSVYDEPVAGSTLFSGSLHYLDADQGTVTTYRGLHLIHEPQEHQGQKICHPLAEMLVSPKTGEFVHPGEQQRLQEYQQEKEAEERRRQELQSAWKTRGASRQPPREVGLASTSPPEQYAVAASDPMVPTRHTQATERTQVPSTLSRRKAVPCVFCGRVTDDYWSIDNAKNECMCHDCLRAGKPSYKPTDSATGSDK